jgi:hypothetical protein
MFRFDNPLDPSKDGINPFIDGIRYHIRDSESIKEEVQKNTELVREAMEYFVRHYGIVSPLEVLEYVLDELGYKLDDLIITDEHELIDWIRELINY